MDFCIVFSSYRELFLGIDRKNKNDKKKKQK